MIGKIKFSRVLNLSIWTKLSLADRGKDSKLYMFILNKVVLANLEFGWKQLVSFQTFKI